MLLTQLHGLFDRPLRGVGVDPNAALTHFALAEGQLFLRHRNDLFALDGMAAPAFLPPLVRTLLDVDRAMLPHNLRSAVGGPVVASVHGNQRAAPLHAFG